MAVMSGGYIRGKMNTAFGDVVFQGRKGQQIIKSKPEPMHLKGVKGMKDDELKEWANTHGMSLEKAKSIRSKQRKLQDAISACNAEKAENPAEFNRKYTPRKDGETSFNVCVGEHL